MSKGQDAAIKKAIQVLRDLSNDPETVRLAELREKAIRDEVSNINGAREEGRQEGRQEEKFGIALKMLEEGLPSESVVKITGLTLEEVSKLKH